MQPAAMITEATSSWQLLDPDQRLSARLASVAAHSISRRQPPSLKQLSIRACDPHGSRCSKQRLRFVLSYTSVAPRQLARSSSSIRLAVTRRESASNRLV